MRVQVRVKLPFLALYAGASSEAPEVLPEVSHMVSSIESEGRAILQRLSHIYKEK